jgi:hypothetical protein
MLISPSYGRKRRRPLRVSATWVRIGRNVRECPPQAQTEQVVRPIRFVTPYVVRPLGAPSLKCRQWIMYGLLLPGAPMEYIVAVCLPSDDAARSR